MEYTQLLNMPQQYFHRPHMVPKKKPSPRSRRCRRHKPSANPRHLNVENARIKKEATPPRVKKKKLPTLDKRRGVQACMGLARHLGGSRRCQLSKTTHFLDKNSSKLFELTVKGNRHKLSHPNRWRNHRGAALSETDCPGESITTISYNILKVHVPYHKHIK
ncbi:hypothetical protein HanPI659440_Chr06g0241751 [Helianthus annuus]|nr:hypothetical protein HanPI659440_Chr06g0241751 [Helianthus annuus]